ncbi:aldo/keto reductase [Paenibacillaceae bacterium]|nr:aldo/keto reductase [Paenibacillaceae bacterium]
MEYRILGRTGLNVSVIGLGTYQFGGEWGVDYTQEEVNAILGKGKELGINLIDTAECYGDHLSERLIGGYLKEDNRSDWIIATKFGHHFNAKFNRDTRCNADDVQKQLEDSLRALGTDYVDLYQYHSLSNDFFQNDELWTMLDKQKQAGKIVHLGLSIGANDNVWQTDRASEVHADTIQVVYNRVNRKPEQEVFPSCERQNLGVLARVPLASGFLSGKYNKASTFPANDVRSSRTVTPEQRQAHEQLLEEIEHIGNTEVPEGVPMSEWALAWCLQNPVVSCVIPGCKNAEQVEANARAVRLLQN